jgi:hypothetical protein
MLIFLDAKPIAREKRSPPDDIRQSKPSNSPDTVCQRKSWLLHGRGVKRISCNLTRAVPWKRGIYVPLIFKGKCQEPSESQPELTYILQELKC